jgi:hypothetical protein
LPRLVIESSSCGPGLGAPLTRWARLGGALAVGLVGCGEAGPDCVLPASTTADDSAEGEGAEDGWISAGPVSPCADPAPTAAYADRAAEWGLVGTVDPDTLHLDGGGAAVADFDGDGAVDLVLANRDRDPLLLRWTGAGFAAEPLAGGANGTSTAAMPLDGDGDGDLDLVVTATAELLWYQNEGGTLVLDPGRVSGLPPDALPGLAPADPDGDGDVDLLVAVYQATSTLRGDRLLVNDGEGRYTAAELFAGGEGGATFQPLWLDADGDGDSDAYFVNDRGPTSGGNALFHNEGGAFVDRSVGCGCAPTVGGMGGDVGDVNGDGAVDLFLANSDACALLLNMGEGTFFDAAVARGAAQSVTPGDPDMVWGAALFDRDNDGDLDLFAAHGDLYDPADPASTLIDVPDALLDQGQDGTFHDVAPALGLDALDSSRAVVPWDWNEDGLLDLLVTGIHTDPHLWVSEACTANAWVELDLVGRRSNRYGLGAKVELTAGGRTLTAWSRASAGVFAGRDPRIHLGLGDATRIEHLRVT